MAMGNVNTNLLRRYKNKDIHRHYNDIWSYLIPASFFHYNSVLSQFRLGGWVMK